MSSSTPSRPTTLRSTPTRRFRPRSPRGSPPTTRARRGRRSGCPARSSCWRRWQAGGPVRNTGALKVALDTVDGGIENIWITPIGRNADGTVSGILANAPLRLGDLALGDRVEVPEVQVVDWTYRENGRLRGHFTTRVFLLRMPPADAANLRRMLTETPVPPGW